MDSTVARSALESLLADLKWLLLSPREVTERLDRLAAGLFARRLCVKVRQLDQEYVWGALDHSPSVVLQRGTLNAEVKFEVLGESYPETAEEQEILPLLNEMAKALWGDDMRPFGGLAWKRESVRVRIPKSVKRLRGDSSSTGSIAILFADLDNFKALNDQAGHEKGDDAIRLVNRELHDLCLRHGGLTFHPSGDEFYLILPDRGLLPMMEALYDLRTRIQGHPFEGSDGHIHKVDLTLGLQLKRETITYDGIQRAIAEAEGATRSPSNTDDGGNSDSSLLGQTRTKDKRRGQLSIARESASVQPDTDPRGFARLGAVIVRRRSCLPVSTFPDPRLGMMELVVQNHDLSGTPTLDSVVSQLGRWLDISIADSCAMRSLLGDQPPKEIPSIAVALAVASGLLRKAAASSSNLLDDLAVIFSKDGSRTQVVAGGKVVWGDSAIDVTQCDRVDIVAPGRFREPMPIIGLQIGLSDRPLFTGQCELPNDLFSHLVVVDDRPNSGGGLPDFWQVAVAQVCQYASAQVEAAHVFAWGKTRDSSETIRRLKDEGTWSVDEIASLAGVTSEVVQGLKPVLKVNLALMASAEDLVNSLYSIAPVEVATGPTFEPTEIDDRTDVLRRAMLGSQTLDAVDGIRCRTAAQAYPIVIDVLRRAATRQSSDDALQSLRELIAFKLVLESPHLGTVPSYLADQQEDMQRYADSVLLQPTGRIRSTIEAADQVAAFKSELEACYRVSGRPRSTRRALLVVPHLPIDGSPAPEGLVSVWASPRVVDEASGRLVDWVFVWRTVEAFIGFPYSLYGSIQLAQSLLAQIAPERTDPATELRLGQLTYVALSLHMRVDGVHQRIAKRIVDLSSD